MAVAEASEGGVLAVANDNAPGNVVVSGEWPALERLPGVAQELGAKRGVPRHVGGALHSPLMAPAAESFRSFLAAAPLRECDVPLIANATAEPTSDAMELRGLLGRRQHHR